MAAVRTALQTNSALQTLGQQLDPQTVATNILRTSRGSFGQIDFVQLSAKLDEAGPLVAALVNQSLPPAQQGELARVGGQHETLSARANALKTATASPTIVTINPRCNLCGDGEQIDPRPKPPPKPIQPSSAEIDRTRRQLIAALPDGVNLLNKFVDENEANSIIDGAKGAAYATFEGTKHLVALANSPAANKGFAKGFGLGLLDGLESLVTGVGLLIANAAEYVNDSQPINGFVGDIIRGHTGRLPGWIDAILPSNKRANQSAQYTATLAKNVAVYVATRELDNSLLVKDVLNFIKANWPKVKDSWQAAHNKGAAAEGEWFGRIAGRAVFEIAATLVPVEDVLAIGRAAAGVADLFRGTAAITDAAKVEQVANEAITVANKAINNGELAAATYSDLERTENALENFDLNRLPDTAAGRDAAARVNIARLKIRNARKVGARIETPNQAGSRNGIQNPNIKLTPTQESMARLTPHGKGGYFPTATIYDLQNLTKRTGHEFAIFKNAKTGQTVVVRGDAKGINFSNGFINVLKKDKWTFVAHSQPGVNPASRTASAADQNLLKQLGQERSTIINADGKLSEFTQTVDRINVYKFGANQAEDFYREANLANGNSKYSFGRYTYETDSEGRVSRASGQLEKVSAGRPHSSLQTTIGNEGKAGDVGFHLIGDQFNGQINRLNVVPGNGKLNGNTSKAFGAVEQIWSNAIASGKKVEVDIRLDYTGSTVDGRPEKFIVKYRMNGGPGSLHFGNWITRSFLNKPPV